MPQRAVIYYGICLDIASGHHGHITVEAQNTWTPSVSLATVPRGELSIPPTFPPQRPSSSFGAAAVTATDTAATTLADQV